MAANRRATQAEMPTISKSVHDVKDAVKRMANEHVDSLRDTANDYLDQGRSRVQEVGEQIETHVQEKPMKSLLVAGIIGFLLGIFWVRR
jgi:ElaB/YqjD/DUF883 family membrane-anchored ribosome-binding protein